MLEIEINGIPYKLTIVNQDDIPFCFGECNKVSKEIKIAKTSNDKKTIKKTVIHEITHAYFEESGYKYVKFENESNAEEYFCDLVANVNIIFDKNKEELKKFIESCKI